MIMNINKNSAVQEPPIEDKRCNGVYCPELNKHWKSGVACAEEIGVSVLSIYNVCNGVTNTCKGMHFSYEKNVAECQEITEQRIDVLEAENEKLRAERDAEKELADQMRAILAEREAKRKAEQERLELIDHTKQAIQNAKAEQERIKRIIETYEAQYKRAESDLVEMEQKEQELTMKLLKLEGKVKED